MKKNIAMAIIAFLAMTTVATATVTPTILINGNSFDQTWRSSYGAFSLSIKMETTETASVDWWVLCLDPSGAWKHLDLASASWKDGIATIYQSELFSFGYVNVPLSGLDLSQSGKFVFFFGIDKSPDGQVSFDTLAYSCVGIDINPSAKSTQVTIAENMQILNMTVSGGYVYGFVVNGKIIPIAVSEVKSVMEVSDRVGWTNNSIAVGSFDGSGVVNIPSTANNDKALWALKLSDGTVAWVNTDDTDFYGITPVTKTTDGLIEYGNYNAQKITIANGQAYLDFACNLTDGFVSHVDPANISYIRWNSDATGWNASATITGKLEKNTTGNYFVSIYSLPASDSGLFSVVLKDGTTVWMNIDKWKYSGAKISNGLINY